MKTFLLSAFTLLAISPAWSQVSSNQSSQLVVAADDSQAMQLLATISDLKATGYSKFNDADAKAVQFLHGETVNPFNSYLVLTAGGSSVVFPILYSVADVSRITFSAIGELTVNYTQSTFDEKKRETIEKKYIKIKFTKTADGTVNPKIEIIEPEAPRH